MTKKRVEQLEAHGLESLQIPAIRVPEIGFIREPVVLCIFPWSRSTLWNRVKAGHFPAPVHLGPRVTAWNVAHIRAYIDAPTHWEA